MCLKAYEFKGVLYADHVSRMWDVAKGFFVDLRERVCVCVSEITDIYNADTV